MATVFLARDLKHERPVALKVLKPDLGMHVGAERFTREIKVAARLQHPHILGVYDSGETPDGLLWYAMPFVQGETLRTRMDREGQMPLRDALRLAREVAQALDSAHKQGVVHRDIKPENILLEEGQAVVADFGIARAVEEQSQRLTGTGLSIGTPAYMSPEQASGDPIDARADVYALGCVLYEMLAGEPPHTGRTMSAVIAKRLSGEIPPLRRVRPAVPESVERLVTQALALAPADRHQTAGELAEALEEALAQPSGPAPTQTIRARKRSRVPILAGAALVVFALAAGGYLYARRGAAAEGPKLLAVLPFENEGAAEDDYFADGIADAVRGKLAELPSLRVISRSSSAGYKGSGKGPTEIAKELGADYLLTATVRWDRKADGTGRVRVRPELVRARDGTSEWQEPFDAPIADLFDVQAQIATRVAERLDIVLGVQERRHFGERPTQNLAAYDAFLKAEAVSDALTAPDPGALRRAITNYETAVSLDPAFALAWARLSIARAFVFRNGARNQADTDGALSALQAAAQLNPRGAATYLARGIYQQLILNDHPGALAEFESALKVAPGEAWVLSSMAVIEQRLGRWDAALAHIRQALALDPRSVQAARRLAWAQLSLRRHDEAQLAIERAKALAPGNLALSLIDIMIRLARGDSLSAHEQARTPPQGSTAMAWQAFLSSFYELYWLLPKDARASLLNLPLEAFDGEERRRATVLAQTYYLDGEISRARVYADSAIRLTRSANLEDDAQTQVFTALMHAYLGDSVQAEQAGMTALKTLPTARDAISGAYVQHQMVRVYVVLGQEDKALDVLEPLLQMPFYLTPAWLRIDPNFAPLKGHPRFEKLIAQP